MNWYIHCLKNYTNFQGRASRTEYWMFTLFQMLILIGLIVVDVMLSFSMKFGLFQPIYALATLIPSFAVAARRLHDIGMSGWRQLIMLVPLIGPLALIFFLAKSSQPEGNRFGPVPANVQGTEPPVVQQTAG